MQYEISKHNNLKKLLMDLQLSEAIKFRADLIFFELIQNGAYAIRHREFWLSDLLT